MVRGLNRFIEHFEGFSDQYVLIGGAACDLALGEVGIDFRATQDLDIVLCAEALTRPFVEALWAFVRKGEYEIQETSTGRKQFYRFSKPRRKEFPAMLEFFSRVPDALTPKEGRHLVPIRIEEETVSLSAILLDDAYYAWIMRGQRVIHGVPIVDPEHIIPLKARAWLDLTARKTRGKGIDSRNIKKHKNDVFRLVAVINPVQTADVPQAIKDDLRSFLIGVAGEEIDFPALGLGKRKKEEVLAILKSTFGL